jgi:hypothetical protein
LLYTFIFSDANCVHIYKENGISLLIDLLQLYIDEAELLLIIAWNIDFYESYQISNTQSFYAMLKTSQRSLLTVFIGSDCYFTQYSINYEFFVRFYHIICNTNLDIKCSVNNSFLE